jgi:hypothetical protein
VQSVNISAGRQAQIDNFTATRCTIVCRYPNGYYSPISGLLPGAEIMVETSETGTGAYGCIPFLGKITDVSVQYGIPYASNVGNADYLTLTCEGALAQLARTSGNGYSMAAGLVTTQLASANTESGVLVGTLQAGYFGARSASAATVSGSWADWLNKLAFTFAGRIGDWEEVRLCNYQPVAVYTTSQPHFSDTGSSVAIPYDQISFDSIAQNYFTQVTVDPDGFAAQTVSTGAAPYRNFTTNTWSSSTGAATDLANFYLNLYDDPSIAVSGLHVNVNTPKAAEGFYQILNSGQTNGTHLGVGLQVPVVFRGTTTACIIEGGSLSATPGSVSWTIYVSGADLNSYLVLDNPVLGKLDENKLGF